MPSDEFDAIAPKMEAALQDFGPIRVTLASFSYFSHSKTSKTLFCDPDDESKAALKRVYARLEAAFPFCVNAGHDGFTPHLTLGQFGSDVRACPAVFVVCARVVFFVLRLVCCAVCMCAVCAAACCCAVYCVLCRCVCPHFCSSLVPCDVSDPRFIMYGTHR